MKFQTCAGMVEEGDFLPDLDNGYVIDVANDASTEVSWNRYGGAFPSGMTLITFHDAEGEENFLILANEHPIIVERR